MTAVRRFIQSDTQRHSETAHICRLDAEKHLGLVRAVLRRFPHKACEREDLYQQGCLGLMKAVRRFDPAVGTSFTAYAASMILGEMRMYARLSAPIHIPRPDRELRCRVQRAYALLTSKLSREPTIQELSLLLRIDPMELTLLLEEVSVSSSDTETENGGTLLDTFPDPDTWIERVEWQDLINRLPDLDRKLLECRINDGCSQAETAVRLGITQIQVSRRERVLKRVLQKEWYYSSA